MIPEDSEEARWLRNFEAMRPEWEKNELEFIKWLRRQEQMHQVRMDKFQVGDMVSFVEVDPYDGYTRIEEEHRKRFGKGPYKVEEVSDVGEESWKGTGHTQMVIVNDKSYSGWWFQPVRGNHMTLRIEADLEGLCLAHVLDPGLDYGMTFPEAVSNARNILRLKLVRAVLQKKLGRDPVGAEMRSYVGDPVYQEIEE